MNNVIIFKLKEEEQKVISDLIQDNQKTAETFAKKEINQAKYLRFKAKRTPDNVKSRIEIMLRRDMNNILHIYKHLIIERRDTNFGIHKLLYPKHLKNNKILLLFRNFNIQIHIMFHLFYTHSLNISNKESFGVCIVLFQYL